MSFSALIRTVFNVKPRKLSKLLRISSEYHKGWGGDQPGMCIAACSAYSWGKITKGEREILYSECRKLMRLVDTSGTSFAYLCRGLEYNMNLKGDSMGYCRLVYEAWIDKLESEGK